MLKCFNHKLYIVVCMYVSMLWFKRKENVKTTLESDEYRELKVKLVKLESEILGIITAQDLIRDKVLRKIQYKRKDVEEEEENKNEWGGIPVG